MASVLASGHQTEAELVGVCTGHLSLSALPPLPSYWTLDGDLLPFVHTHVHTCKENPSSPVCLPHASYKSVSAPLWFKPFTTHSCPAPREPHSPPARAAPVSWTSSPFQLFKPCRLLRVQPGGFAYTVRPSWGPSAPF